jgi:hypothetical protein
MALPKPKRLNIGVAHRRAPKQEKETATRIGGLVVRGSGCGYEKGDVRKKGVVRVECKTTTKKSFSVTRSDLVKIETEALSGGEIPAYCVEFIDAKGKKIGSYLIMPEWALEHLIK